MEVQELKDKIAFATCEGADLELMVLVFIKEDDNPYQLNLPSPETISAVKDTLLSGIDVFFEGVGEIREYSTSTDTGRGIYRFDLEVNDSIGKLKSVIGNDFRPLNMNGKKITNLDYIIAIISDGHNNLSIYKTLSIGDKVLKGTNFIGHWKANGEFGLVDSDLLRISPTINGLYVNDNYFFDSPKFIETQFKVTESLVKRAKDNATTLNTKFFGASSKLKDFCDKDISLCKKISSIVKDSTVIKKNIARDKIIEFIENDPELSTKKLIGKDKDGQKKLNDTSLNKVKKILSILNDDFLISKLTEQEYVVVKDNAKKARENLPQAN